LEGGRDELGVALEDGRDEPGVAETGVSRGGVAQGGEQPVQQVLGERGAAVVDVGAGGQGGQVGLAVGLGQMGEAGGAAGDVDATAADRIVRGGAVTAVRSLRRSRGGCVARV
jgi:hypothetical protein